MLFDACLRGKQSFVIDNTNPLPSDRARYIGPARAAGFQMVAYYFETSFQDAIRRNNQRLEKRKIPVVAVAGTFKKIQPPMLAEGFDALHVVTISLEGSFAIAGRGKSNPAS
ncbi:MAG: AAA family ATPase [Candidatus Acidiferrales bacterium]